MKLLFIGGTGTISTSCVLAALTAGHDVSLLCRGTRNERIPKGVTIYQGDAYELDPAISHKLLNTNWDCVINWTIYNIAQARIDIERFRHNTSLYFFISSTSVYDGSNNKTPIVESQNYLNTQWFYAKNKIEAEKEFLHAFKHQQFPVVIIRPGHTYNDFTVPTNIQGWGYGLINRILEEDPVLIHDEGQSYWTLTHSYDFANYLITLFGMTQLIGETIHIATEEYHTWNDIFSIYADLLGKKLNVMYLSSDEIYAQSTILGEPIVNDKRFNRIFNLTKLKNYSQVNIPFISLREGLQRVLQWHHDHPQHIFLNNTIENEMQKMKGLIYS